MLVVTDFEATCWDKVQMDSTEYAKRLSQQEIIEIGCIFLNPKNFNIVHKMSLMVKPVFYPVLSPFCTQLTGITQQMVDNGAPFGDAFGSWCSLIYSSEIFCSWGKFDDTLLHKNCEMHETLYPFTIPHLNLKHLVADEMFDGAERGVKAQCEKMGLDFVGSHHRGLDDVENIVRILKAMCDGVDKNLDVILNGLGYKV